MRLRPVARVVLLALGLASVAPPAAPQGTTIERVEIEGNRFLRKDTLLYYVSTKPGDAYDEIRLKEDFRRLWDTGFLDDLRLEVFDGPQGKIVVFHVLERPRVQIVDFRGSKALSKSDIEDKLKEKDAQIRIDSFYDLAKARQAEAVIRQMLEEKGRLFGSVSHEAKTLGGAATQVVFTIDDGPKSKIKTIQFDGNDVFDDGELRGALKKLKQAGFWNLSWLGGKASYSPEKWEEARTNLETFYLNHGYVTASIGEPRFSYEDAKSGFFKKKPIKWQTITIPVNEGGQYRVGKVAFEGLTVFPEEGVRALFKIREGDVYNESRIEKGYEKLRDAYGAQGYFQWTALTQRNPDPERKVVDLVLKMEEDKRYYVGRIGFAGNDSTRDKVIRREVYLNEGDVFNTELLKLSIRRINQLGYFKPMEGAPDLRPSARGDDKIDVTFRVEEQNRNQFTFGGGVSGLEGTFINASFATSNFLGLGETFQISAQSGRRTKNYQLAITEPYLFDRPITAGIDLYKRRLEYQTYVNQGVAGYVDDRTGISLITGLPVGRFSRVFLNYTYERVNIGLTEAQRDVLDPLLPVVPTNPIYLQDAGVRRESRVTPSYVFNTVDNPWTPRDGWKITLTPQVAGGPLGGTIDYFRPNAEAIWYIPHTRKTALGMRVEGGWITPFGDTAKLDPNPDTGLNALPFYLRYYLGGENQIRGYNIRSVGPRGPLGQLLGGNKFVLFNAEYYIDLFGPLRFLFFLDAGQAYREDEKIDLSQLRTSTGAELRFIMPVLNVPFRLIYAWNFRRDDFQPNTAFKFAVGTTF